MSGMKAPIVSLVMLLALHPSVGAVIMHATDPVGCGVEYEFDSARISKAELTRLWTLAPERINDWSDSPWLEVCLEGVDQKYKPCGSRDWKDPNFISNGQVNLGFKKAKLNELSAFKAPPELEPVIAYQKRRIAYTLWIDTSRLNYYQTWNVSSLNEPFQNVRPAEKCTEAFKKLESAKDNDQRYSIARIDWDACVAKSYDRYFSWYPDDAWQRFLKAYGIKMKWIEDCGGD
jgi:hypothetical protein